MFIDIHAHAYRAECPLADGHTRFATPDQVLRRYDELGIERGALLPLIGPETYLPQSNEEILVMAERWPGRFLPFISEFQDRLMFGTDICRADQELPLAGFLIALKDEGRIGPETFDKVARKNAVRLLKLSSFPEG